MRLATIAVAVAMLTVGCGGGDGDLLQIGIKRSALDLVFKDEEVAKDAEPKQALVPQPAPAQAAFVTDSDERTITRRRTPFPTVTVQPCPTAGPDVFPDEPVTATITKAPAPGLRTYRNEGTFKVEGALNLEGKYPPRSQKTINVLDPVEANEKFRLEVVQHGLGQNVTTTTYRVVEASLDIVSVHTKTAQGESMFQPTPPVRIMQLGAGEGQSWNAAGVDQDTGTAMVVQGQIEKRELVDVCGKVYDTYRVISDETMTNLATGFSYETNQPTVYNIATQLGGLFLREDVDSTTTYRTAQGELKVHLDYVSTANNVEPEA